ncbi:MAG: hypothetical protein H0W25_03280 [Acidimicrobiia bacterium]|nr:hypothetical protein [Acidimicrobiia bacterium]
MSIPIVADNGSGRAVTPGRSCADGGTGAYWHHEYGVELPAGRFAAGPSEALVHLDVHSDTERFPNVDGPYPGGANPAGFLQGSESHASLLNDRGSVKLRLTSGTCAAPTLTFDGSTAAGAGTWAVDSGSGAYRSITGSGAFTVQAGVDPGADNPLNLNLSGNLTVPTPALGVTVVRTYWGGLGTDYVSRRVSVVYRITNTGPGDSFGVRITALTNPTNGVTPFATAPIALGDLASGESAEIVVRHQLGLLAPCALVILGCNFETRFTVSMPDALDIAGPALGPVTVAVKAPTLPPPL